MLSNLLGSLCVMMAGSGQASGVELFFFFFFFFFFLIFPHLFPFSATK